MLSRRFIRAALDRWNRLPEGQDTRVIQVCAELSLPLWYTMPCLVEHAPLRSVFGTPPARAVDFVADRRLTTGNGFQPPDGVPGTLTPVEGRALWEAAAGRDVIELGTGCGRGTVCLAQSARAVTTVGVADPAAAAEWVRRFGLSARVEFRHATGAGDAARFGLAFVGAACDESGVRRDLDAALTVLRPGGLIAVHNYPDPVWPDVRRVVDEYALRLGWERIVQADYLGVFQTLAREVRGA
ncbi:class I SAM-dependent methyltransferase [Gemmata sp. JC717]|uniref:class I SAM-dependent methyltransferase n=1 Tax=Gemmata algarum TaxID=2975278 RepID=UPI0021BA848C|nr:class I SAM-dependent methyltransferase [Gemmata algarum]MDY3554652.1 class I SAM-dependent methyltransferase [Gemmata algarum]